MQALQLSEHYTDKGHFAVMTRTTVLKYAKLARIAGHLCRNAEDLLFSTSQPTIENCRTAGMMLGWAYNLVSVRMGAEFNCQRSRPALAACPQLSKHRAC